MRPEEGSRPRVAAELHLPQLLPRPVGVQVGGPDEGQVHSQRPEQRLVVVPCLVNRKHVFFVHKDRVPNLWIPLQSMQIKMP